MKLTDASSKPPASLEIVQTPQPGSYYLFATINSVSNSGKARAAAVAV